MTSSNYSNTPSIGKNPPLVKRGPRNERFLVSLSLEEKALLDRLHEDYGLCRADVLRSMLGVLEAYITTSQGRHGDYDRLLVTAVTTGHPLAVQRLIDAHSKEFWQCMSEGIHPYSDEALRQAE